MGNSLAAWCALLIDTVYDRTPIYGCWYDLLYCTSISFIVQASQWLQCQQVVIYRGWISPSAQWPRLLMWVYGHLKVALHMCPLIYGLLVFDLCPSWSFDLALILNWVWSSVCIFVCRRYDLTAWKTKIFGWWAVRFLQHYKLMTGGLCFMTDFACYWLVS